MSAIITTVSVQATALNQGPLRHSPMSFFLLMSTSMKMRMKGSSMPLTICDTSMMGTSGSRGMSTTSAPITRMEV